MPLGTRNYSGIQKGIRLEDCLKLPSFFWIVVTGMAETTNSFVGLSRNSKSISIELVLSSFFLIKSIPHIGQVPGASPSCSGCMGQVYMSPVWPCSIAPVLTRSIPHLGHLPGLLLNTESFGIGQVYISVTASGLPFRRESFSSLQANKPAASKRTAKINILFISFPLTGQWQPAFSAPGLKFQYIPIASCKVFPMHQRA